MIKGVPEDPKVMRVLFIPLALPPGIDGKILHTLVAGYREWVLEAFSQMITFQSLECSVKGVRGERESIIPPLPVFKL